MLLLLHIPATSTRLQPAAIRKALPVSPLCTLQHHRQGLFLKYSSSGDCLLKLVRQWLVIAHIFLQSICINITIDQVPSSSSRPPIRKYSEWVSFFVDSSITSFHEPTMDDDDDPSHQWTTPSLSPPDGLAEISFHTFQIVLHVQFPSKFQVKQGNYTRDGHIRCVSPKAL